MLDLYILQAVDMFLYQMACDEPDQEKCAELDELQLSKDEWEHVKLLLDLLVVITWS